MSKKTSRLSMTFSPSTSISKLHDSEDNQRPGKSVENAEFAAKKWVWTVDDKSAFIKGFVVSEEPGNKLKVRCSDDSDRIVESSAVDKVNPPQFDKADDMAELTFLNEASVVHNLSTRYTSDSIYTYSGLFLVAVNPYAPLPIYDNDTIQSYKNKNRDETKPHIYAITDLAFRNMLDLHENQSILVTGESGAGKTENTKKVIQYLAAITSESGLKHRVSKPNTPSFEQQILQANPILESFGNAQTVRNNNSSRFGKFIRIEFSRSGQIAGASIDWYLLEKSRVIHQNSKERNYHIFYQMIAGAPKDLREALILESSTSDYRYLKDSNKTIQDVDDKEEYLKLTSAMKIMGITTQEQNDILRVISAILHIGNIELGAESSDQGRILNNSQVERVCHLLGINSESFSKGLLRPKVKAGREWVTQSRSAEQVRNSLDALAKSLYERLFAFIVNRINHSLERSSDNTTFIGVLDIAGFEIFDHNSFEQLCINYTNEKLQQFFNHHMFVLEQEEYTRENIEWKFIDFGHDLQPTIDLIEKSSPMGIFSCLDEDCVMPKTTDKSFTDKLNQLWDKKSEKFKGSRLTQGFTLTHYAAEVEYSTDGWLEKNKDPLNDNVTQLLVESNEDLVKKLFADEGEAQKKSNRVKKGLFRTVAQRHKEQLTHLMTQLHSTHPHFVRCIIPNHDKKPKKFDNWLVLDQLRCNGVLEGIRIARSGYPNRLFFSEFRQRYEVLVKSMPKGYVEGQKACSIILSDLGLDENLYKVGLTKVFFKSGVLAELEERRESMIRQILIKIQSTARGSMTRARVEKQLFKSQATRLLKKNLNVYLELKSNPWWKLYVKMRPLLMASRDNGEKSRVRDAEFKKLEASMKTYEEQKQQLEDQQRKTEQELEKVKKDLEGERLTALDKEEILKRAQARESDLEEQLNSALEDLDKLETQCDQLLESKRKVDAQADIWKKELENGAHLISVLEGEKKSLKEKIGTIEVELESLTKAQATNNTETSKLTEELSFLKGLVAEKEKKVHELELKLKESDGELEGKLKDMYSQYDNANKRIKELVKENKDIRDQLDDLYNTSSGYEELVRKKEKELDSLKREISTQKESWSAMEVEKAELQKKYDSLNSELTSAQREMKHLKESLAKVEREANESKKLLEAKISQDEKESKSRKMLDKQVVDLKLALSKQEESLSAERLKFQGEIDAKQRLIDSLQKEKESLQEADEQLKILQSEKAKILRDLEKEKENGTKVQELRGELSSLKSKLEKTEKSKQDTDASMTGLQRDLQEANAKVEDLQKQLAQQQSQKDDISEEVSVLKRHLKEANDDLENMTIERTQLSKELDDSQRKLSSKEFDNDKLQQELSQKNGQIEKIRASITEEVESRVAKLTEEKETLEASEQKLKEQLEELNIQYETTKMQKDKMVREIEDLNHDVSREQKAALSAERMKNQLQEQYDSLKEASERQRRDRSETEVAKRKLTASLEATKNELTERTDQLMALQRIINPKSKEPMDWSKSNAETQKLVDLSKKLQESEKARKEAEEKKALIEAQMNDAKKRWSKDLDEKDSKYYRSKRAILDDLASVNSTTTQSPPPSPVRRTVNTQRSSFIGTPFSQRTSISSDRTLQHDDANKENLGDSINSKPDINGKSVSELEDMFASLQNSKNDLLAVYHDTSKNLVNTKELLAEATQEKTRLERELYNIQMATPKLEDQSEISDLKVRLDTEISRNEDLASSMRLYKGRAEEYYNRLESAETVVLKATRAESFAKKQLSDAQEALKNTTNEYKQAEKTIMDLQQRLHSLESEVEDKAFELQHAKEAHERSSRELEYLNNRHSQEAEISASSLEAIRGRYSEEISSLSSDLETEKQRRSDAERTAKKLERQIELLKQQPNEDEESWANIKNQLEEQVEELSKSNEESTLAYRDAQKRIGSLLSQVRTLRTTMDEITVDRDQLQKDKRVLEQRLSEVSQRFEELGVGDKNRSEDGSNGEEEVAELRAALKKQTEASSAVLEKLRMTKEQLDQDQHAIEQERALNEELRTAQAQAEREKNSLNLRIIDLEARLLGPKTDDNEKEYLQQKVADLEERLNQQQRKYTDETRQFRTNDRELRDLQSTLQRKDKLVHRLQDDVQRYEAKVTRLNEDLEEIQSSETNHRVQARRAEREARDAKERSLRLEKELEDWKSRFEQLTSNRQASFV